MMAKAFVQFTLRLDPDVAERFKAKCEANNTSMAKQAERLLDAWASEPEPDPIDRLRQLRQEASSRS